jgi:hypothetical protein
MQFYSDPRREKEKYALPNCEAFEVTAGEWWWDANGERVDAPLHDGVNCADLSDNDRQADEDCPEHRDWSPCEAGWYYWYCLPGCMPDSDPLGPYETAEEAIKACQDEAGNWDEY